MSVDLYLDVEVWGMSSDQLAELTSSEVLKYHDVRISIGIGGYAHLAHDSSASMSAYNDVFNTIDVFCHKYNVPGEGIIGGSHTGDYVAFGDSYQRKMLRYYHAKHELETAQAEFDRAASSVSSADIARWKLENTE